MTTGPNKFMDDFARLMTDMGRPQDALDLTEEALTQYRQNTDVIPTCQTPVFAGINPDSHHPSVIKAFIPP